MSEQPQILLVEDDKKMGQLLADYLSKHGYPVEHVAHGDLAAEAIERLQPALLVLDMMLPGKDGLTICREARPEYSGRILFLTASEDDMDQVAALELGADDFVCKPIQPRVLLARIRMLLRREELAGVTAEKSVSKTSSRSLTFGQLQLQKHTRSVMMADQEVLLTQGEFDLIWLLASHAEQTLSREFLFKETRGIEYDGLDRSIDTKVVALRKKLGDNPAIPKRIITVRGKGYLFVPDSWD